MEHYHPQGLDAAPLRNTDFHGLPPPLVADLEQGLPETAPETPAEAAYRVIDQMLESGELVELD